MKSTDSLPAIPSATPIRLQQERHRRSMELQRHAAVTASTTEVTSSSVTSNTNRAMMPMKPIILSRKRGAGSGGLDRKKLTELLNEALSISINFDMDSNRDSANSDDTNVNDMTVKK